MKILLNPIGSIGDVNPYLGLGESLARRGHRVIVLTNPRFESIVRRCGFDFVPIGTADEWRAFHGSREAWNFFTGWRPALHWGALGTMRETYSAIEQLHEPGHTVSVGPGMAFGARMAQEKLGIPHVTIHLEPDKLPSAYDSPVLPPPLVLNRYVPRLLKQVQLTIAHRVVIDRVVAPPLNEWRRELGLSPVRNIVGGWWNSPQRVLGMFPTWFAPPQPDWPRQTILTGFPLWDQASIGSLPNGLRRFLDAGPMPIVFTTGTANKLAVTFHRQAVEICRNLGCRGLLLTGGREQAPAELPPEIMAVDYAPMSRLLPECRAIVHHGGIGTTAQAVAAGVPQLIRPITFSQPDTAMRLKRLGIAATLSPRRYTVARAAQALRRLLASATVKRRCEHFQAEQLRAGAFQAACEVIESLCGAVRAPHYEASRTRKAADIEVPWGNQ